MTATDKFGPKPKDALGACIWAGQCQGWELGTEYERKRWRDIVDSMAKIQRGAVQAALWQIAEMLDRNLECVHVKTN